MTQVRLVQATLNGVSVQLWHGSAKINHVEDKSMKRKPGRPPSANTRQNVRIRLPRSAVAAIDALIGSIYPDRTAVIEQAIMAYLKSQVA